MFEIMSLFAGLAPCLNPTVQRQLAGIVEAVLSMTGRVTMLGISRWTGEGGSYRTVQRFFTSDINWRKLHWIFVRRQLLSQDNDVRLIVGDEVIVTKSGKKTFGLDRFFSSLYGKVVPGMCFLTLSIISVNARKSYPVSNDQFIKNEKDEKKEEKDAEKESKPEKRKPGRPKGSCNKNRRDPELSASMLFLREALSALMALVGTDISVTYFVYDGALGNNAGMQTVRQCGLHIISKLRYDSALYFPYTGAYAGRGAHRKYGKKLIYSKIPSKHLKSSIIEDGVRIDIYHVQVWHKLFTDMLNVVIILKTCIRTGKSKRAVLYSSDLELSWEKLKDYCNLRFQIEFNFRDAKQFWGLEDFMNIGQKAVHNAANLSIFMVNFSNALLLSTKFSGMSVTDLKAWFCARKYVQEAFKLLPQKPERILIERAIDEVSRLGRVNLPKPDG